uniref:MRPL25 domain-containing protein n=1 Tax=Aegilops tauschii subsp. strangulata TaxID=200361 RepID=A0A452XP75_AEGTS
PTGDRSLLSSPLTLAAAADVEQSSRANTMTGGKMAAATAAKWAEGYPWKEKLAKYKGELSKGVWGYWELGAWKPLGISGRQRARLRKEVLLAGEDWAYDPPRGEMRTKRKGHKVDRIAAEK